MGRPHLRRLDKEAVIDKLTEEIELLKREVAEWKQTVESQHWDLEKIRKENEALKAKLLTEWGVDRYTKTMIMLGIAPKETK